MGLELGALVPDWNSSASVQIDAVLGLRDDFRTGRIFRPKAISRGHMALAIQERGLYRNYPLLSRLEWHLSIDRHFAYIMDHFVAKLRFHWHNWRRKRLLTPASLMNFESRVFSQNGEDGILQEIFRRIGDGGKFSVEFGIEDGTQCCTRELLAHHGWSGVLLEGSPAYVKKAQSLYKRHDGVQVGQAFITAENILSLFQEHDVPQSPDLLVVDIDGNDYWVLQRILSSYRPRVLVCEYNARWASQIDWVMPYDPGHVWDGSAYYGASLAALLSLGEKHGYKLVCCESRGVNAFFVRADLTENHFPDDHLGLAHYVPPHFGRGYGHPIRFRYSLAFYKRFLKRWRPVGPVQRPSEPLTSEPGVSIDSPNGNMAFLNERRDGQRPGEGTGVSDGI